MEPRRLISHTQERGIATVKIVTVKLADLLDTKDAYIPRGTDGLFAANKGVLRLRVSGAIAKLPIFSSRS